MVSLVVFSLFYTSYFSDDSDLTGYPIYRDMPYTKDQQDMYMAGNNYYGSPARALDTSKTEVEIKVAGLKTNKAGVVITRSDSVQRGTDRSEYGKDIRLPSSWKPVYVLISGAQFDILKTHFPKTSLQDDQVYLNYICRKACQGRVIHGIVAERYFKGILTPNKNLLCQQVITPDQAV